MLDARGDALYVGKARNLKSRVVNYTHTAELSNRLRRMVAETATMEVVVTHTEVEALLLECNLIKRLMPRYNVLLRDDKSFPFIHITAGHDFPAAHQASRRARQDRRVFRPLRLGRRGQSHADRACSAPSCCARAATASSPAARGPACSTRSSAAARPASAASTQESYGRWSTQARGFLPGAAATCRRGLPQRHAGGFRGARFRGRRR